MLSRGLCEFVNSRGVKPEDLDPERRRGTTLPTTSDLSSSVSTHPVKRGFNMRGFLPGLILGAAVATFATYLFYRADIKALNDRWEEAGRTSTTGAQDQLDAANRARRLAEESLRKLQERFSEMRGERERDNIRVENATKKIDAVRRSVRRKAGESESDKAAALDEVRNVLDD